MSQGAAVGAKNSAGETPLHLACAAGHLEFAQWLVAQGAAIDTEMYAK